MAGSREIRLEGGREVESPKVEVGAIAQLGERLLCKQEVVGSIPSGSTSREVRPKHTSFAFRRIMDPWALVPRDCDRRVISDP